MSPLELLLFCVCQIAARLIHEYRSNLGQKTSLRAADEQFKPPHHHFVMALRSHGDIFHLL